MTFKEKRILAYLKRFPKTRAKQVAALFGVSEGYVNMIRRRAGVFDVRKSAALARNMKAADLDEAILAAVYRRDLIDTVLNK